MAGKEWDIIGASYVASAVKATQYPQDTIDEVAFIGRSNVGKSSLLNSLARRKGLARVSSSPGKTQTINFYSFQAKRQLEDEPERHFRSHHPGRPGPAAVPAPLHFPGLSHEVGEKGGDV